MHIPTLTLLALSSAIVSVAAKPTVYLIRHGEKPADDDETGLSAQGEERAQCLRQVFGASSGYNIGYIMAMTPKSSASPSLPFLHFLSSLHFLALEDGF